MKNYAIILWLLVPTYNVFCSYPLTRCSLDDYRSRRNDDLINIIGQLDLPSGDCYVSPEQENKMIKYHTRNVYYILPRLKISRNVSLPVHKGLQDVSVNIFLPQELMNDAVSFNNTYQMREFQPIVDIVSPADMPRLLNFDPRQKDSKDSDLLKIWESDQGAYGYFLRSFVNVPKGALRAAFFENVVFLQKKK